MFHAQEETRFARVPIWVLPRWSPILVLCCLIVPCANAQLVSRELQVKQKEEAISRSGALVGLSSGQTLWIAPADGKIHILVAQDNIIPRKDGFWRVRLDVKWTAQVKNDEALSGAHVEYGRLWAVPLKKGMDAVAWAPEPTATAVPEKDNQDEGAMEVLQREADEEAPKIDLLFLSPDYLSCHDEHTVISSGGGTGASDTYTILKITDPPGGKGQAAEQLFVNKVTAPIPSDTREKDLTACIDPGNTDDFKDEDFLRNAQEATVGIKREKQKWVYIWVLGYETSALRGYHTECAVSILPPKGIVGSDDLFPNWKQIKSAYPAAEDAFSSPSHDLLLIVAVGHLIVAPLHDNKIGDPLADITLTGNPVMVQWAIGKYVDAWTKELTPYFHAYAPASSLSQSDPTLLNDGGLKFMQRHLPQSAVGLFIEAARLDPSSAEYANNAGFAYYQMGKYNESLVWLQKTVSINPRRAVAYFNLGDAYTKLKREAEARQAYAKYLELAPNSKSAPKVKRKLDAMSPSR